MEKLEISEHGNAYKPIPQITHHFLIPIYTGIGNAVLLTPLLSTLKNCYPTSSTTLIGTNKGIHDLFANDPRVDHIIEIIDNKSYTVYFHTILGGKKTLGFNFRIKNPNALIITQRIDGGVFNIKEKIFNRLTQAKNTMINPNLHETIQYLLMLNALGISNEEWIKIPSLNITSEEISAPQTPYCIIQIGAANNTPEPKIWPIDNWQVIIEKLTQKMHVIIVGSKNEAQEFNQKNVHNLIGKTTLPQVVHMMTHAQFFLGVDSGLGHISGALNNHTLILWGPTHFNKPHQVGKNTHFITLNKPCSPCRGPEPMGLLSGINSLKKCAFNNACMKEITVESVLAKLINLKWIK